MGKSKKRCSSSPSSSSSEDSSEEESDSSSSSSASTPAKKTKLKEFDDRKKQKRKKEKKKKKKKRKKSKKQSSGGSSSSGGGKDAVVEKISASDYYMKNSEFRSWIRSNDKIQKRFEDMETTEAKSLFANKFVKKWNERKLGKEFYKGAAVDAETNKSDFQWSFAQSLDSKTKSQLDAVKKDREQNEGRKSREARDSKHQQKKQQPANDLRQIGATASTSKGDQEAATAKSKQAAAPKVIGPILPAHIARNIQEHESSSEDDGQEEYLRKMREKRFKDDVKTTEEELCPKATGFEAKLEKRALDREKRRQRDTSPGLSDKVLFGDSSKMGKAIEKRKEQRAAKQEVSSAMAKVKLAAWAEKEKAKMDALLEMAKVSKKEGALW